MLYDTHAVSVSGHSLEAAPPEVCNVPELDGAIAAAAVEPVSVDCQRPDGALVTPASEGGGGGGGGNLIITGGFDLLQPL